jgi:hypothetical protein
VVRGALAHLGVLVFGLGMIVPSLGWSHAPGGNDVVVAAAFVGGSHAELREIQDALPAGDGVLTRPEEVAASPEAAVAAPPAPSPLARAPQPPLAAAPPAPIPSVPPSGEPPPIAGVVVASWYGPGFYGNRTACGHIYTPEIVGVAHRTLPCGTLVTLSFRGKTVTVPVIDRGPYVVGRTLDLSNATRLALACTDLCTLSMRIGP